MKTTSALLVVVGLGLYSSAWARHADLASATVKRDIVTRLLEMPAGRFRPPLLPVRETVSEPPVDDAPIAQLTNHWRQANWNEASPTPRVRERLLAACEVDPKLLPELMGFLPDSPVALGRIKKLWDANQQRVDLGTQWSKAVARFLMLNGPYFRDRLIELAKSAADDSRYPGVVTYEEELQALARLDWQPCEPLLKRFAQGKQPRLAAKALVLLYKHHASGLGDPNANELRGRLKALVTDKSASGSVRATALDALMESEWPGRDDWYLALFADASLLRLHEDHQQYGPLETVVEREPDKWIPIVKGLVGNKNRAAHDMAVSCLVQFHLEKARADALRPLLPWLKDPKWSSAADRLRLIQSMDRLDMKESIPGLISVLGEKGTDEAERGYAAESLAHFRDPSAVPALRRTAIAMKQNLYRGLVYQALLACGGVPAAEAVAALEEIARTPDAEEMDEFDRKISPRLSLGQLLSRGPAPEQAVVTRLLGRARALAKSEPTTAERLEVIMDGWQGQELDRDFVRRLRQESVSAMSVALALDKRESMRTTVGDELRQLVSNSARAAAVATVLLGDERAASHILHSKDEEAKAILLACARKAGLALVPADVAVWLKSEHGTLAAAAEAYLRAEDGEEAKRLLLLAYTGQARITGHRMNGDPGHFSYSQFDKLEEILREDVLSNKGPDEVLALLSAGYWGDVGQILVELKGSRARLLFRPDPVRWFERELSATELAKLREFLVSNRVEALGPLDIEVYDGIQFEFLQLTKAGGRRVFMNNPDTRGESVYSKLCEAFLELLAQPGLQLHYAAAEQIPGLRILIADPVWNVLSVRKDGVGLMVEMVEYSPGWSRGLRHPETGRVGIPPRASQEDESPPQAPLWISWPVPEVLSQQRLEAAELLPSSNHDTLEMDDWLNRNSWAARAGSVSFLVGRASRSTRDRKEGLWRLVDGKEPELLVKGLFANPVLSADRRWVMMAKATGSWAGPNPVVRVNLATGRVQRIDIAEADTLAPVIPVPGGVLVEREREPTEASKGSGPERPEHFVVDPASGLVRRVEGDFSPLARNARHPYQSAGPDRIWATRSDGREKKATLGRYDLRHFTFDPVMELPMLPVESSDIWVDEADAKVYVVFDGHLLCVPLTGKQS